MLSLRQLSVRYGKVCALHGLDLEFSPGEITALLGPNGSGKSTLLKAITGTLAEVSGEMAWNGRSLQELTARDRARIVAYVPQEELPEFDFTVREVVLMGRHGSAVGAWETEEDHRIAENALRRVDALHLDERPVTQLSGGERQRVFLARGLAQATPVLLLDEPIAHLDPAHQVQLRSLLGDLRNDGLCIVVAVHDVNWAYVSTDRTVMLRGGKLAANLPTCDLATDPRLAEVYGVSFRAPDETRPALIPAELARTESRS